jgi:VWFA-related protein
LSQDDFAIVEDDRPQTIQSFSLVDLPADDAPTVTPAPALSIPPDVHSNTRREGRLYVILMDSPSTHAPPGPAGGVTYTALTRRVMREFVEQAVGPNDLVAVVHTHGTTTDAQTFTTDKQRVFDSIERYGRGLSGDLPENASAQEKGTRHLTTFRTIEELSTRLGTVGGRRKSVIWVGAQLLFGPPDCDPSSECSRLWAAYANVQTAYRDAIRAATRHNVAIYAVDPVGLSTATGSVEMDRQNALRVVSDDTGASSIVGTNNFAAGFASIVRDNSTYYVLGYAPDPEHRDGKFHDVQVRVKRPGLQVRARRGYFAPTDRDERPAARRADGAVAAAQDALRPILGVKGLEIDLAVAPFPDRARETSVVLIGRVSGPLLLSPKSQVALAWQALDKDGRTRAGEYKLFTLNLRPDSMQRAQETGLHFVERITLRPGEYELRVAASEGDGASGSVVVPVTVPAFDEPLAISGVMLRASQFDSVLLLRKDGDRQSPAPLEGPATSMRRFRPGAVLSAYAEISTTDRAVMGGDLSMRAAIVKDTGLDLVAADGAAAGELTGNPRRQPFVARLDTTGLPRRQVRPRRGSEVSAAPR